MSDDGLRHSSNTMKYYSAIRNDEIFTFVTVWMDLEWFMLSEIDQREKYQYLM